MRPSLKFKLKTDKRRTVKHRLRTDALLTRLTPSATDFLARHVPLDDRPPEPGLDNDFRRVTLVNAALTERVTVDVGLRFGADEAPTCGLPGIAVVEAKQAGMDRGSALVRQMRLARVRPTSVSKNCVGAALLYEAVKRNAFKPKLRTLHKLMQGGHHAR